MTDHTCAPVNTESLLTQHPDAASTKEAEFVIPATTAIDQALIRNALLGHGLVTWRTVNVLDPIIKEILEEQYQKGVTNSSNRKGVLEMVEVCGTRVPFLLSPSINSVSGWLGNRLNLAKQGE
jgi:hypothetical protein